MVHLTGESFDSTVKRKKHALIMFYAPWYSRHYTSLELYVWRHGDQCHVEFVNCITLILLAMDFKVKSVKLRLIKLRN